MAVKFGVEMASHGRLLRVFQRLAEAGRGRRLYEQAAGYIVDAVKGRFTTKQSPEGQQWKKWSPEYAETRSGSDSLLVHTRALEGGIRSRVLGDIVAIGVEGDAAEYAAPAHKVRPFMGVSRSEEAEVMAMIESSFLEAIDGA